MSAKVKTGFPFDEAMRTEHAERVVRPAPDAYYAEHDPADASDHGPHVDRVGMVAVDADSEPAEDEDKRPRQARDGGGSVAP